MLTRKDSLWKWRGIYRVFSPSLPGAPLKVCPQGYSCCTLEMEDKLSQQSYTEIKAPVSRLSTNLQSTFKQKHDHFDSKQTQSHKHTQLFTPHCAAGLSLMDAPTCLHTARSWDSLSVFRPVHLSPNVSAPRLTPPPPLHLKKKIQTSLFSRERCMLPGRTTHIFRFSRLYTSCSSVCEHMCVCL